MTRLPDILMLIVSLLAATVIWLFAAGWAGRIVFLPNTELLKTGDWSAWLLVLLMYGPIFLAALSVFRLARYNGNLDAQD